MPWLNRLVHKYGLRAVDRLHCIRSSGVSGWEHRAERKRDVVPVFTGWANQPELGRDAHVADAIAVRNLVGSVWEMKEHVEKLVVVSSSGIQDWHANCQTPTTIEFVSQRHIEEIDGIHDFRVQRGTLRSEERRVGKECRSRWSPYH